MMPKLFLPHDLTAAERQSGCVWASRFRSAADEIDKGGVITGTPVFERTRGVTLDGTTEYIQYGLNNAISSITNLSITCEFYPTFAHNDGASHLLFDSYQGAAVNRIIIEKSVANNFDLFINSTYLLGIPAATLATAWVQNGRNVFTVFASSANNNMILNGLAAATSAVAWASFSNSTLDVGCRFSVERFFSGRIASLQFYNRLLSREDHLAVWEGAA